ncbi:MAG: twin-arginine translocase subunit TatC [Rhodobacteraceae bacterium]|nr:twin-arginine translocase subunit TatC [Paracoccaceae bacterium]
MDEDDVDNSRASLIEHLTELRKRLIYCILAFLVGMVVCFAFWEFIFQYLTDPICNALVERGQACNLILIKLQEGFFVAVRISVMGGIILAFPYISFQMWRFVAPGLYRDEKSAFLPFMLASPFMFLLGAAFAFLVVIPLAFNFFLGFQQDSTVLGPNGAPPPAAEQPVTEAPAVEPSGPSIAALDQNIITSAGVTFQGSVAEYLTLTIKFILAFGLCFQLPVLLTLMGKAGLVSAGGLAAFRKYAVVAILTLAAVVTPPDVITQVILFTVVYGLYEISIFLVARVERRRVEEYREQGIHFDDDDSKSGQDQGPNAGETGTGSNRKEQHEPAEHSNDRTT